MVVDIPPNVRVCDPSDGPPDGSVSVPLSVHGEVLELEFDADIVHSTTVIVFCDEVELYEPCAGNVATIEQLLLVA